MSGIFLIVWCEQNKEESKALQTTKGGYPHITLAYTGKNLSKEDLLDVGSKIFRNLALKSLHYQKLMSIVFLISLDIFDMMY
jgi:hypothetical protein